MEIQNSKQRLGFRILKNKKTLYYQYYLNIFELSAGSDIALYPKLYNLWRKC